MNYSILLGGIGGDSHSVGLAIIRNALLNKGYKVNYIGIQNNITDFIKQASNYNVVMISNMDGHILHYLARQQDLKQQIEQSKAIWMLGGNLSVDKDNINEGCFKQFGFAEVFMSFIDITSVITVLQKKLSEAKLIEKPFFNKCHELLPPRFNHGTKFNFLAERAKVLSQWHTGKLASNFVDNAGFLQQQANFVEYSGNAHLGNLKPLLQPRSGVSQIREQFELFEAFKKAGAQLLSYQIDSLTRNNLYELVEASFSQENKNNLNGFPLINHDLKKVRALQTKIAMPMQTRHSTRDPRLLAELSYAAGVTSFEGGSICYNIPYYKNYTLAESIQRWMYVDQLTGHYYKNYGIKLDREFFGTLTATLIPPCLAITTNLLESLLAAAQGVKSVSLGYAEQGNRIQDVAAIKVMKKLASKILTEWGYVDVQVNTVFHQYMAAFPKSHALASQLIYHSMQTATIARADRIIIKTPVESYRIPSCEDNVRAIKLATVAREEAIALTVPENQLNTEMTLIEMEVMAIFNEVVQLGNGNLAEGIILAFNKGVIDIPFSPSLYNKNKAVTIRSVTGAIRFLNVGNLPFPAAVKDFHKEQTALRCQAEKLKMRETAYLLLEKDVLFLQREHQFKWPLDQIMSQELPYGRNNK